jgi:proteic killer suppression protein
LINVGVIIYRISVCDILVIDWIIYMIKNFSCADTELLFSSGRTRRWSAIQSVAERKLTMLHAAATLESLRVPPGNRLEALKGNRAGQHSIRINDQWRICFVWAGDGVSQVEIVDYH